MHTTIQKWGNSQGIRLVKSVLEEASIAVGDEVDVVVRDGEILVKPARRLRGKYRLDELLARMPDDHRPEEEDWGPPAGREEW